MGGAQKISLQDAFMRLAAEPDLEKPRERLSGPTDGRTLSLQGLFGLALFYTLYLARELFLLIVVALLLNLLLRPIVRALNRARIPEPLGAALALLALGGLLGYGVYALAEPASDWMDRLPRETRRIQQRLESFLEPVKELNQAAKQVEQLTDISREPKGQEVTLRTRSLGGLLASGTQSALSMLVPLVILLYFLLSSGDLFLRKLIAIMPRFADKLRAARIASEVQRQVSTYLLTTTLINMALGTCSGLVLWAFGMPNAMLFGAMVGLLNFIPVLGATVSVAVIGLVAILSFASAAEALTAPLSVFVLHLLESNVLTPLILGRRLSLNPVVIFLGMLFWSWMWGIIGALLAVPILVTVKVVCDHTARLAPLGEFLGR
jgi:predicted PurR-regulated permease PerM